MQVRRMMVLAGLCLASTASLAHGQDAINHPRTCPPAGGSCEGTEQSDLIVAGNNADEIFAKGGNDDIELDADFTSGTADVANGGPGRDCIDGGGGGDLMLGGPGDDNRPCAFTFFVNLRAAMTGGPGNDRISGGPGNDSMDGIFDDDTMLGDEGNDLIQDPSPRDRDTFLGGAGNDTLNANDGDGRDLVDGGPGIDNCTGDPGDTIVNCEIGTNRNSPSGDTVRPEADLSGVPARTCARRPFTARISAHDTGGVARTELREDQTTLDTLPTTGSTDTAFAVRVPVAKQLPGRHLLTVDVQDEAGNTRTLRRAFRRCP
ncbi:MAG: calcium binding hemolysin protein, partial [Solirubrobacterales bacterium]|nr:calcium binding hemolysin protein [Solirubrobacterales bacterium]